MNVERREDVLLVENYSQTIQNLLIREVAARWRNIVSEYLTDKEHRFLTKADNACHRRWRINAVILAAVVGL